MKSSPEQGYLALPATGAGPGVVVLHAWWGLNDFFRELCDRLAAAGFVAYAPDLYGGGAVAATVEEAQRRLDEGDGAKMRAAALGAVDLLRGHPAVRGERLGAIGFSMGAAWAAVLSELRAEDIAAVVMFYGAGEADFSTARAAYQGHFAEGDPWEPEEYVRAMEQAMHAAGREVELHSYAGAGHWFFEADRPDAYHAEAAAQAWERTLAFLRAHL
jgi:carboxymethylenebutenolidase